MSPAPANYGVSGLWVSREKHPGGRAGPRARFALPCLSSHWVSMERAITVGPLRDACGRTEDVRMRKLLVMLALLVPVPAMAQTSHSVHITDMNTTTRTMTVVERSTSIVYVLQWVDIGKACVIGKVGADARMSIRPTYTTVKTNNSKTPSCYWRIVSEKKAKN